VPNLPEKLVCKPIIVTRPQAQACSLVQALIANGRAAIVFPLLEIHPLEDNSALLEVLTNLSRFAMVAFVSPNAIDAAFGLIKTWPKKMTFAVMGEGSRVALAKHGINDENATIVSPHDPYRSDSNTLIEALDIAALSGKSVLIIRGQSGRELLADALRNAGVLVTQIAAYRRTAPTLDGERRAQLSALLDQPSDWFVSSSEALHILKQQVFEVQGVSGVAKMQQQTLFVPHFRIAETARNLGFIDVILTGSGDEGLLAALQSQV